MACGEGSQQHTCSTLQSGWKRQELSHSAVCLSSRSISGRRTPPGEKCASPAAPLVLLKGAAKRNWAGQPSKCPGEPAGQRLLLCRVHSCLLYVMVPHPHAWRLDHCNEYAVSRYPHTYAPHTHTDPTGTPMYARVRDKAGAGPPAPSVRVPVPEAAAALKALWTVKDDKSTEPEVRELYDRP